VDLANGMPLLGKTQKKHPRDLPPTVTDLPPPPPNVYLHIHRKAAVAICSSLVFCRFMNTHGLKSTAKHAYKIEQHAAAVSLPCNVAVNK